jgi:hypothetical protein
VKRSDLLKGNCIYYKILQYYTAEKKIFWFNKLKKICNCQIDGRSFVIRLPLLWWMLGDGLLSLLKQLKTTSCVCDSFSRDNNLRCFIDGKATMRIEICHNNHQRRTHISLLSDLGYITIIIHLIIYFTFNRSWLAFMRLTSHDSHSIYI